MATLTNGGLDQAPLAGKADSVLLYFHGLGSNGSEAKFLFEELAPALPRTHFHAPNAPFAYDPARDPKSARTEKRENSWMWYDRFSERTRVEGLNAIIPTIDGYIDEKAAQHGVGRDRVVAWGFSQGCILVCHVIPRLAQGIGGFIAHSGYLFSPDSLAQRRDYRKKFFEKIKNKTPLCAINGMEDRAQSWQMSLEAATTLDEAGVLVESHIIGGMGHAITKQSAAIGRDFILRVLKAAEAPSTASLVAVGR